MIVEAKQVELYETEGGEIPYEDWFDGIRDGQTRNRIKIRMNRLRTGNLGRYKGVGGGVIELALDFGPGYRVYAAPVGTLIVLLLCAGDKSTQVADIAAAKEYWADYLARTKQTSLGEEMIVHAKSK
jgi:putative addiction module killer protein